MSPDALLGWLPAPVLVGLLYAFIKREFAANDKRWARIEGFLETSHKLATKDELTNVGNRFDDKLEKQKDEHVKLRERVALLEKK